MSATTQLPWRVPPEMADEIKARAQAKGISVNAWLTRAALHALEHAKAEGEPPALRLPWSVLL